MTVEPSRSKARSYLSPARPRLLAHRGLAIGAPENTLLAFLKALALGAEYIETDVHASLDGVAVISHDPHLARVAGRDGQVEALTLAQLRRIDLGYGQTFSSLAEALDAFPATRFNIDVKSIAAVQPTVDAIRDFSATNRVLVSSFSERRRRAAVDQLPGVATSTSAPRFVQALIAGKLGLRPIMAHALRGTVAVQVPEKALGLAVTTERMLDQLHSLGVEMHVWTINDPRRMRELLALGVDGIVTDRVDLALAVKAGSAL
ncbi:MAG: glycerophosphodiester phosphodiesterase [Salinibacterium sp.]|nr:glycerophosphodiester phosphodiesterase [Salinibacterium sp.]